MNEIKLTIPESMKGKDVIVRITIEPFEIVEEKLEIEKKVEKLHLKVVSGHLIICYQNRELGYIDSKGRCYIMSTDENRDTYASWVNDGMLVSNEKVEWKGKKYFLDNKILTSSLVVLNDIYNFLSTRFCYNSQDENIMRHKNSLTPIAF
jgi:hypothetical protein